MSAALSTVLLLLPQVVLCAVWAGGMLAAAYYTVETGHLYIMPDAAEREDFGLLRRGEREQECIIIHSWCECAEREREGMNGRSSVCQHCGLWTAMYLCVVCD